MPVRSLTVTCRCRTRAAAPASRVCGSAEMFLLRQHVVLDVADGQRAVAAQQPHHLAHVLRLDGREPSVALAPVPPHCRTKKRKSFAGT